jgi:galactose mutarotase-like enzyme
MLFQSHEVIELQHPGSAAPGGGTRGRSSLLVAPQAGGRLLRWVVGEREVIRWPDDADWSNPPKIRGGDPLLFPFIGRHRVDGRLGFWRDAAGRVYPLATHGFARDSAFAARLDDDGHGVRVSLTDNAVTRIGYPFAFTFEAHYRLLDGALEIELCTRNRDSVALPYYAGHHFYFALPHALRGETTLTLPSRQSLDQEADGRLGPPVTETGLYRLDDPAIVDRFHLLSPTAAGAGAARLETPSLGRTIDFDLSLPGSVPWYAVTTWTETPAADFYCIEPWLGLPDAIHHGQGLRWIAPGASERAIVRLSVSFDKAATA